MKLDTKAIHAGQHPEPTTGAVMTPVFQTSTYAGSNPRQLPAMQTLETLACHQQTAPSSPANPLLCNRLPYPTCTGRQK